MRELTRRYLEASKYYETAAMMMDGFVTATSGMFALDDSAESLAEIARWKTIMVAEHARLTEEYVALIEERISDSDLRSALAWLESPAFRNIQALQPHFEAHVRKLEQQIRERFDQSLGVVREPSSS